MSEADLFARANSALKSARLLLDADFFDDSVSRAYYAMFYAAEAVLLSADLAASTHKGVARLLAEHFVRPGALDPKFARMLARAGDRRQSADYAQTFVNSKEEAEVALRDAHAFVEACEKLLGPLDAH